MGRDESQKGDRWEDLLHQENRFNERTILKSGSFLRSFCPHCEETLMEAGMIRLETTGSGDEDGWVELSPYLNVFDHRSSISLAEGQEVGDLRCPRCHHTLRVDGRRCGRGDSHVACMMIGISSMRVPFYFCMRMGCRWHLIDPEDIHRIILDDSTEW